MTLESHRARDRAVSAVGPALELRECEVAAAEMAGGGEAPLRRVRRAGTGGWKHGGTRGGIRRRGDLDRCCCPPLLRGARGRVAGGGGRWSQAGRRAAAEGRRHARWRRGELDRCCRAPLLRWCARARCRGMWKMAAGVAARRRWRPQARKVEAAGRWSWTGLILVSCRRWG